MSIQWKKEEIDKIIYDYVENHKGVASIAKEFKVSESAINAVLKHNNIVKRTIQQANGKEINLTEKQVNKIIYNYTVLKKGLATAGKEFGYSQYMVEKLLKERKIQKRNYTESKQSSRIYKINDNYFKIQSNNMAYILGFLAADGNVAKRENSIRIELNIQDISLLQDIKKELNSTRKIDIYTTSQGRNCCKLQFWSSEIKKDLAVYNIVPNKTFILKPPTFLDKKYFIDFIRGYFDGDGSVYIKDNNRTIIQFDGASKPMIEWIRNVFNSYGISTTSFHSYKTDNNINMYKLTYYNQETVKQIYQLFYYSDNLIFLKRKQEKFFQETLLPKNKVE